MNIVKILKTKEVGAIGIGAMIVFIAMVLVAGIAASVLIQTSTRLESQALATGSETTEEVAGGIAVDNILGEVNTDITELAITVRVRAGSPDIDLNHTVIELTDGTTKVILSYDEAGRWNLDGKGYHEHYNGSVHTSGNLFATGNISTLTNEEFGIIVMNDPDSSMTNTTPVINSGDFVTLTIDAGACFTGTPGLDERTDVYGMVIPEQGSPGIISFTTPSSYSDTIYDLQ